MFSTKSNRWYIGTAAERTASGSTFLPGDRYLETDTNGTYIYTGMEWKPAGNGIPGGTDAQIQFNNAGAFGGAELYWDTANGRLGIGTNAPENTLSIVLGPVGGITMSDVLTDMNNKDARILLRHYDNSEEEIAVFGGASFSGESQARFGGGFGVQNAVTRLLFYAAATTTTLGGTLVGVITSTGMSLNKGSNPVTSAALEIGGADGAVLLPRLTTTQRNALTAANGMIIYNTTNARIEAYEGGTWVDL